MKRLACAFWFAGILAISGSTVVDVPRVWAQARSGEPTLDAILDDWADALGGREKLAQAGTMRFQFRAKIMGMEGEIEAWSSPEGQQRVELDLGGMFHIVQVLDRDHGWALDQNGKVVEMTGKQLEGEITGAYLGTWSHLLPGRMQGTVEYAGREEGTGLYTVIVRPQGGGPVTFFIDPESHLAVRSEQAAQERVAVTTYKEWTEVDGIRFPKSFTQSMGDPRYDSTFEMVSGALRQTAPANAFAKPQEKADDVVFTAGDSAEDIPIELNGVHVFVQARVNDSEPLWFILDTGASVTVVEKEKAKELGLEMKGEIEARGAGEGSQEASFLADVTYQVGTAKLVDQKAMALPMRGLEGLMGREIDGILGYDFISRFVTVIDYDNRKLHLYDRKGYEYSGSGKVVPLRLENGHPHVQAVATPFGGGPIQAEYLLDTGAGATVSFALPFVEKHDLLASLPKKAFFVGGGGVGGETKNYIGRIGRLEIDGFEMRDVVCGFSQDKAGAGASPDRAGLIGGEVLNRFKVFFDYERNRMMLEPGAKFGTPFEQDLSGFAVKTGGRGAWHEFTVRYVQKGSAAEKAGLMKGDKVLSFDGRPAEELTVNEFRELCRKDPRKVKIVIERDGKKMTKTLELKPMV